MKSYSHTSTDPEKRTYDALSTWEELVVNAVGQVIEFWGFKRNYGRLWALLYLRDEPLSSKDIQRELELSKGAVSMLTRDLENWDVLHRQRVSGRSSWHFIAENEFLEMIRTVVRDRELGMVERVRNDLADAAHLAKQEGADENTVERIQRMERLADLVCNALKLFLSSARLDVTDAEDLL